LYAIDAYGGVGVKLLSFLTLPLDGSDWSISESNTLTISGNLILDNLEKEKNSYL
jgi:hypothetical protein